MLKSTLAFSLLSGNVEARRKICIIFLRGKNFPNPVPDTNTSSIHRQSISPEKLLIQNLKNIRLD